MNKLKNKSNKLKKFKKLILILQKNINKKFNHLYLKIKKYKIKLLKF